MDGWIKISRNIMERDAWGDEPFDHRSAWIDLLILANFKDKKTMYKGEMIVCKRGTVNKSISYLAKRWKWDRKTVSKFLRVLEMDNQISTNISKHRTTINIVNYEVYQGFSGVDGTTKRTTKSQPEGQPSPIKKERKKEKKEKNNISAFPNSNNYDFEELERAALERLKNGN